MKELTEKQALVYKTIRNYIDASGFTPTNAEIARILTENGLPLSTQRVHQHLKRLEVKGYIKIIKYSIVIL